MTSFHDSEKWLAWMDTLSEQNYVVIDDFLSDPLYVLITDFFLDRLQDFDQAGIGIKDQHQVVKGIRGDLTYWLDAQRDASMKDFWSLVDETMAVLNRYCFLSLSGFEFHLAHYPAGSFYKQHLDQFKGHNNRMISMVIYLNEGWKPGDGGELELIDSCQSVQRVEPIARRCILFKSAEVLHAVLPANKSRYSLTGWLLYHSAFIVH